MSRRGAPPTRRDRDGEAGFTLLEIVVALVVLGILLLTLARGTQFGLAAFDRQNRMVDTAGRLEAVDRALRRLVAEADPGNSDDGRTLAGAAHAMAFRAPLPTGGNGPSSPPGAAPPGAAPPGAAPPGADPAGADLPGADLPGAALPGATLRGDDPPGGMSSLRLSVQDGALVLFSTPFRHVIETGPVPPPTRTVLLDRVERLDLSYWADGHWQTGWDGVDLPELVRIRIVFPDGDGRRWPDIVAAPMRHQPG